MANEILRKYDEVIDAHGKTWEIVQVRVNTKGLLLSYLVRDRVPDSSQEDYNVRLVTFAAWIKQGWKAK